MKRFGMAILVCAALAAGVFTGCTDATSSASLTSVMPTDGKTVVQVSSDATTSSSESAALETGEADEANETSQANATSQANSADAASEANSSITGAVFSADDLFTDRDLEQTADTSGATRITVTSGEDVTIEEEGVYVLSGTATDVTIAVNADDSAKVQLVLDGLTIENSSSPAIYVVSADKVFVTTAAGSVNSLSVTEAFSSANDDNVDGVIFAKDDLVLNGEGSLEISSTDNGIVGKDDVKVTGGTYVIKAAGHGIQGKDSVAIADGTFSITTGSDGVHSKNSDDASLGYIFIAGGDFTIEAGSDGFGGTSVAQIDGGTIAITAAEGIEATYVQINGGSIAIKASDDGINATSKSTAYNVKLEINGGDINIEMGAGDTDALDANGDLVVNGGTVNITAQFAFDFDGKGELNGGTVIVNGEQVAELENSMMGGGMGGWQGDMDGGRQGGADGGMGGPGHGRENRQ